MATKTTEHTPSPGDVYKDNRSDEMYEIIYIDKQVVLLRSEYEDTNGNHHRIEPRKQFNRQVAHNRLSFQPDSDINLRGNPIDWSTVSNIGDKTTQHLHEAGYKHPTDIQQASDEDLLDISGIGSTSLRNIREFTR